MFHVDPDDSHPLYLQVADGVRWGILRGSLRPDDPLPSVRELAGTLRLNPNTIQQAYRELERDELVYVRRGQGTFVAATVDREPLRDTVAREMGGRFLREAHRAGLTAGELIEGIRGAAESRAAPGPSQGDAAGEDQEPRPTNTAGPPDRTAGEEEAPRAPDTPGTPDRTDGEGR